MALRNRIKEHIPKDGTIKDVAEKAGIPRVHMFRIIQGKSAPSVEAALRLSHVLEVSVETLFYLDKGKKKKKSKKKARRKG